MLYLIVNRRGGAAIGINLYTTKEAARQAMRHFGLAEADVEIVTMYTVDETVTSSWLSK